MNLPAAKSKHDSEPDWVTNETRPIYNKLKDAPELLGKVQIAIAQHPDNNLELAAALLPIGFHKADGTALGSDKMPRIKKVAKTLSQS
ncbi:hypothetical protein [Chamaesiphon minutus]|uniref:Uncharacterized protein n=1 Tax=Chamaesiphon minutus (strain ATCC 27169 / PCC 6605) TaxID=1173020 RepID=K9UK59_CHAP6|nr:hypothetical protein [Chamaesiphon minutus]AFY95487.1 hypothetical protein Cha6605_4568 [Chamaesiphon minutus PCC 6605]